VRYVSKRLKELRVATERPADKTAVFFGCWFAIEDDTGKVQRLRIVGPDETDPALGWISVDSPLARAVLKKRIDDEFEVDLPGGRRQFVVIDVRYEAQIEG